MTEDKVRKPDHISEFEEAKGRFENNAVNERYFSGENRLDEIIRKLCSGDEKVDIDNDSDLFYQLILHADYIQIKSELEENFYTQLCRIFIMTDVINDIIANLFKIENISHVKSSIAKGFFKIYQMKVLLDHKTISLEYSTTNIWPNINLSKVTSCKICPSAFKFLFSKDSFTIHHLYFLIQMLNIDTLILSGCNLNGRNFVSFFHGLNLKNLDLTECGTSVNDIIDINFMETFKTLEDLNISNNPVLPSTLQRIAFLPLKKLNIRNCLRNSGTMMGSIWCSGQFGAQGLNCSMRRGGIDLLLGDSGVLHKSIEVLNVSHNILSDDDLKQISNLNLIELDLTESLWAIVDEVVFPKTLEILKIKDSRASIEKIEGIFQLSLKKLEFNFLTQYQRDYSILENTLLFQSLKDLSIGLFSEDLNFLFLISKFELEKFCCSVDSYDTIIPPFFTEYPEQRRHLEVLKFEGPIILERELIDGIMGLNLKELTMSAPENKGTFCELISSPKLQENIEKLALTEDYIENTHLVEIRKFRKLRELSFSFSSNIDIDLFTEVVSMNTLEKLDLVAVVRGQFDMNLAKMMSIAPVQHLKIYDDYHKSVSDDAYKFLTTSENIMKISKELKTVELRAVIDTKLADVLKMVPWERITLDSCAEENGALSSILNSDVLVYTLDHFRSLYVDLNWNDLAKLHLSKLEVDVPRLDLSSDSIEKLSTGAKYLRYLFLEDIKAVEYFPLLMRTNLSEIDTYQ